MLYVSVTVRSLIHVSQFQNHAHFFSHLDQRTSSKERIFQNEQHCANFQNVCHSMCLAYSSETWLYY